MGIDKNKGAIAKMTQRVMHADLDLKEIRQTDAPVSVGFYDSIANKYDTTAGTVETIATYLAGEPVNPGTFLEKWTAHGGDVGDLLEVFSHGVPADDLLYAMDRIEDRKDIAKAAEFYGSQNGYASGDLSFFQRLVDVAYVQGMNQVLSNPGTIMWEPREILFADLSNGEHQNLQLDGFDNPRPVDSRMDNGSGLARQLPVQEKWYHEKGALEHLDIGRMALDLSFKDDQGF
tara:strand:- start:304 stop:999 length:696 start_codon:yes stop_codon:yes gene_type:complete